MTQRRQFLAVSGLFLGGGLIGGTYRAFAGDLKKTDADPAVNARFAQLEKSVGGRLGVLVADSGSARHWAYRATERFAMCSTFKLLVAGALLERVDHGGASLQQRIVYRSDQLDAYSPVTGQHVGGSGLSLEQLCQAMLTLSDNSATNFLLERLGGLASLRQFIHGLGDQVTRVDRLEPKVNSAIPGDPRDTTSPAAMVANMQKLLLGDVLLPASRSQLQQWLQANRTGDQRVRAGLPPAWKVGDKTGTGGYGSTNTLAIIWPPQRSPLLAALYLTQSKAPLAQREAVLAEVGRLIARDFA